MYDVLIVGAGPAGLSAALTARQRNLSTLVIYSGQGAMEKAHVIDNYLGLPNINGEELVNIAKKQAKAQGAELKKALVQKIMPMDKSFSCLAGNDIIQAKSVILCCGTARVKQLQNEESLLGQGVSYCATCDGMFYKDKKVIVVGAGAEAVEEANYLATLAEVKYIQERKHDISKLSESVAVIDDKPKAIKKENGKMQLICEKQNYSADGIFVLRPAIALTQLLPELKTESGSIAVDKDMQTSITGVFAAGDMTGAPLQAAKAVGEGNIAALSAAKYIKGL
jgi:thioredoxin reductase (NADPH)